MNNKYSTPFIEIVEIGLDVITTSCNVPDFDDDTTELPKQDW